MAEIARQSFGIERLDELLGGGLLPGTLTVIAGATGAGKTQLGLRWAEQGVEAEGKPGIVCDLTSRGDAQNHNGYALGQFGWELAPYPIDAPLDLEHVWDFSRPLGDYLHPFHRAGKRVTRRDLEPDDWHDWKSDLARVLRTSVGFFYQNFVRGRGASWSTASSPPNAFPSRSSSSFSNTSIIMSCVARTNGPRAAVSRALPRQ